MKRMLVVILTVGLAALVLLGWSMFGDQSLFRSGLRQYEGLPAGSSDITIYENRNISGIFIADFKISEADFASFARENQWEGQPISSPVFVFHARAFHDGRPNDKREITDGLFYSKRTADGAGITAAYDRQTGRAYIDSSSR